MRRHRTSPLVSAIAVGCGLPAAVLMMWFAAALHFSCCEWKMPSSPDAAARSSRIVLFLHAKPRFREYSDDTPGCYDKLAAAIDGILFPTLVFAGGVILHVIVIRRFLLKPVADRRPREPTGGPYPLLVDPRPRKLVFQYSLLSLLVLATALAFIFGLWKYLAG